jgi:hypothetical protein
MCFVGTLGEWIPINILHDLVVDNKIDLIAVQETKK